ncbi:MAG: hypothetical protein ACYTEV_09685 [Planctomycetota bacterium]|jgi:hypothetical protein
MIDGRLELPAEFEQFLGDRLKALGRGRVGHRVRARGFGHGSGHGSLVRGPRTGRSMIASIIEPHPKHAQPSLEQRRHEAIADAAAGPSGISIDEHHRTAGGVRGDAVLRRGAEAKQGRVQRIPVGHDSGSLGDASCVHLFGGYYPNGYPNARGCL